MNRIFHARIAIGQYLFLVLTTIIVIYAMWMQHAVMAVLFMLLLVIAIERLIHTTYTLTTDDRLLLFYGRFSRSEEISLKDIISVERASSMKIGRFAVMDFILKCCHIFCCCCQFSLFIFQLLCLFFQLFFQIFICRLVCTCLLYPSRCV